MHGKEILPACDSNHHSGAWCVFGDSILSGSDSFRIRLFRDSILTNTDPIESREEKKNKNRREREREREREEQALTVS
jgi:hypothetical protein